MAKLTNDALVFTNDKCIGCNKCISVCPVLTANYAVNENNQNKIVVDGKQCISCGACFDACEHQAREYRDDTERFFEDLRKGEKISLLLAPAFLANYPKEYASVLGGLKEMGVNRIISISFGADITTWGYINYITRNKFKIHTRTHSEPCARAFAFNVRCHLCQKVYESVGQAGFYQSLYREKERDRRSQLWWLCIL